MELLKKHFTLSYLFTFLIIFIGGYLELYSLKTRGIFCAMQTGNLLNIFVHLIDGNHEIVLLSLLVLFVFLVGCFLSQLGKRIYFDHFKKEYFYAVSLTIESLLLIPIFFIPIEKSGITNGGNINIYDALVDSLLALYGAIHFLSFNEVNHHSYTPTMMTNMMKNVCLHFADGVKDRNKEEILSAFCYLILVLAFVLGGCTFYLIFNALKDNSLSSDIQYMLGVILILNILLIPFSIFIQKRESKKEEPK